MTNTKPVFHGSDIEKISEYYHIDQNSITNFAGNVNPLGLSPSVKEAVAAHVDLFSSYPDRDYKSLRNTIAEYCDVPADFILPGNGSSELISLLIETRAPKRTLILGPTYSEYSRELSFSGSTQEYYHLQESNARISSFKMAEEVGLFGLQRIRKSYPFNKVRQRSSTSNSKSSAS